MKWRRVNGVLHYCTHQYVGDISVYDTACGLVEAHRNPPIGCFYGVTPLHTMFEDLCEKCVEVSGKHPAIKESSDPV